MMIGCSAVFSLVLLLLLSSSESSSRSGIRRLGKRNNDNFRDQIVWPACESEAYSGSKNVLLTITDWDWDWNISLVDQGTGALINDDGNDAIILTQAQHRFHNALKRKLPSSQGKDEQDEKGQFDLLNQVHDQQDNVIPILIIAIVISTRNAELQHGVDESYELRIDAKTQQIRLESETVFGALRGLQTLLQLLDYGWMEVTPEGRGGDDEETPVYVIRRNVKISDAPHYSYRGLLVDTSRHYLPLALLLENLDIMEINKLNVMHWHLTDSQSWPWQSATFADLSVKGAYCSDCIYTQANIQQVIHEAWLRGIRVIIEVDLPGHSKAIAKSHPEIMTECTDYNDNSTFHSEPLDVTKPETYDFVYKIYRELDTQIGYQDRWIHVGGDEVNLDCWDYNEEIQAYMKEHNMTESIELLRAFEHDLLDFVAANLTLIRRPIVWQEMYEASQQQSLSNGDGTPLPSRTIVDVWKDWVPWPVDDITTDGYNVILSACWYLDHLQQTWFDYYYNCDISDWEATSDDPDAQRKLLLGGKGSMWGEKVDATNFVSRVWPRMSAIAEILWTGTAQYPADETEARLAKFRCHMLQQGIAAAPVGPGSCGNTG